MPPEENEPEGTIQIETPAPPAPAPAPSSTPGLTQAQVEDMLAKARQQEKDKLYEKLTEQDKTLEELRKDLEARRASEAEAQRIAEEAKAAKEREELSAKDLLDQKDREWNERFETMQSELAQREALLERERQFQELATTRENMLNTADESGVTMREQIAPQLLDYVGGGSVEAIAQSIEMARQKSADIVREMKLANQHQRQQTKGASVTAPAVGPMETTTAYETLSAGDIAAMSPEEYAKRRSSLLAAASRARSGAQQ